MVYPIESSTEPVPPPLPLKRPRKRYPFDTMQVGDKFTVPVPSGRTPRYTQTLILNVAARHRPKRFTTRKQNDGVSIGVWRVE